MNEGAPGRAAQLAARGPDHAARTARAGANGGARSGPVRGFSRRLRAWAWRVRLPRERGL